MNINSTPVLSSKWSNIYKKKKGSYAFDNSAASFDSTDENHSNNRNSGIYSIEEVSATRASVSRKYFESLPSLNPFRSLSKDGKIPVNNVGWFSYVFITWMTPLILKLFKQRNEEIREEDVWLCSDKESVTTNTERLEMIWKREVQSYGKKNSSFLRVWLKFTQTRQLIMLLVLCVNTILTFLMTGYMTDLIVSYLESDESNILYAVGLLASSVVGQILRACSFGLILFFGAQTGIRFRAGVLGLTYKKFIRLKSIKGDTSSEIITIFGSDAFRIYKNCQRFSFIIGFPFYIAIGAAYTYYLIGPWCFVAIGIFIVVYQLQIMLTGVISNLRRNVLVWTDERIRLLTEVLTSMKLIKMYAWEEPFEESIKRARKKEIKILRILSIVSLIISSIIPVTSTLSSVATICAYAAFGNKLKASTAFSVVSTMNYMRVIVSDVPMATRIFGETRISFERIKRLLLKEEYQEPNGNVANELNAIEIKDGLFDWEYDNSTDENCKGNPSLNNGPQACMSSLRLKVTDLTIRKGKLIGICGALGCGKSSLISSILGRMPILSGHLAVDGSVAYTSQQAWIFNGTLKDNVVFGNTYNPDWYKKVIFACGLVPDIELLPDRDETEIGDRGINVSGGQKQRVSLARAVYSQCDIYLLDDPLSAVDVHVGKHLFQECINKLLKTKTVILVTHQLQFLRYCDDILVIEEGEIVEQGNHDSLLKKRRKYTAMMEQCNQTLNHSNTPETVEKVLEQNQICTEREKLDNMRNEKHSLTEKEKVVTGSVGFSTYKSYVNAAGGVCVSTVVFLHYLLTGGSVIFSEWWLGIWIQQTTNVSVPVHIHQNASSATLTPLNTSIRNMNITASTELESHGEVDLYVIVCAASIAAMILFTVLKAFVSGMVTLKASERLHNRALARVLKAPMSYFDANPQGRILNRFSKDIEEGDIFVPIFLDMALQVVLTVMMSLVSTAITLPWILIALFPALLVFFIVKKVSTVSILQLKRFENVARSPLLNHVTSTGQGLWTIVSYKQQNDFINKCMKYANVTSAGLFLLEGSMRWVNLRLDLLASMLVVSAAVAVVFTKRVVPTALAALALSMCIKVLSSIQYLVRMINELETRLTSIERMHEYELLEMEQQTSTEQTDTNWPSKGHITFSDVTMKYRNDMDPVLHSINFDILPKQKVGIVGRTGAGKSSLAAALFRLTDVLSGHIFIDGVDIGLIPRRQLRSKLSVIPQDPVLYSGTLRYNLDPFGKHTDSELWSTLEQVHIKEKMQHYDMNLDQSIEENGDNFSVGERQLICLARAILRRNKVLVLDEATASIDTATDTIIQNTIHDSFSDCTVITIAHRLITVLHCDVIFVMESGSIVESGEPQTLLSNTTSRFYKMIQSQSIKPQDV